MKKIPLRNFKMVTMLLLVMILTQGKKCNQSSPPAPKPPPPPIKKQTELVLPPPTSEWGGNGSNYKYPEVPGYNQFPPECVFTLTDIAAILVKVMYNEYDANGNVSQVTQYSAETFTNADIIPAPMGGFGPKLDIEVPESGWYWIEVEYVFYNCNQCCGHHKTLGTGVPGCNTPLPPNTPKGKPSIKGKTLYEEHFSYDTKIQNWEEYTFECLCNC